MTNTLKIIFAGTPDFAVPPLKALLKSGHQVVAVYCQPDRPAGRGRKLTPGPVKIVAKDAGIPSFQPVNFKEEGDLAELESLEADLMVVAAYGLLLPKRVLDAPRLGCINIHASLLPRWRGAAPIQRAILAGDSISGVTIMRMEQGLDTGPMYLRKEIPIHAEETGGSLHDNLSLLGAEALMEALPGIADGSLVPDPQHDDQSCYAKKLEKAEAMIDWRLPADEISRKVRAFNPWPIAYTGYGDVSLRIWEAEPVQGTGSDPGTVMVARREGIDVATSKGLLRIHRVQMPGKRAMSAGDFLNAHNIQGVMLG